MDPSKGRESNHWCQVLYHVSSADVPKEDTLLCFLQPQVALFQSWTRQGRSVCRAARFPCLADTAVSAWTRWPVLWDLQSARRRLQMCFDILPPFRCRTPLQFRRYPNSTTPTLPQPNTSNPQTPRCLFYRFPAFTFSGRANRDDGGGCSSFLRWRKFVFRICRRKSETKVWK